MANFIKKLVNATVPREITKLVDKAVPKEIKKAIPKEVAVVADPLGIGGLNKNPSLSATFDLLNLSGKNKPKAPTGVGVGGKAPAYDETLLKNFNAQLALQPELIAGTKEFGPQWLEIQRDTDAYTAQAQMDLMRKLYPQSAEIAAAYENQNRRNELQQLQTTLPQYAQAFQSLTPGYTQAITSAGQLAQNAFARANVAPQLTAFENQVQGLYRPRPQAQAQAMQAPQEQTGQAMGQQAQLAMGQQMQDQLVQGRQFTEQPVQAAAAPEPLMQAAAAAPPADGGLSLISKNLLLSKGTTSPLTPAGTAGTMPSFVRQGEPATTTANTNTSGVPLDRPLPANVQGPQAPTQQYMDQQEVIRQRAANESSRAAQIASDNRTLAAMPQLSQQQAWGQAGPQGPPPGGQYPPQGPANPYSLQDAYAGDYSSAVAGPQLQSDLNNINASSVNQYVGMMPGMQEAAYRMGNQANRELQAGRGLTPEEQRMATQSARSAYAARGTALGNQAIGAEILNRADVANARYQQRIANASALNAGVQNIYQPALTQSLARQQGAQDYNLGAQQQNYTQAMGREALLSGTQAQEFQQSLQRGQAEQQRLKAGTEIQAGQAQIGAGALDQLQRAQQPILQAYYKQPILQQAVGQAQTMGLASQAAAGNSLFQPESPMGFQSAFLPYQSNLAMQQAAMQSNATQAAGKSQQIGAMVGAGGALLGVVF